MLATAHPTYHAHCASHAGSAGGQYADENHESALPTPGYCWTVAIRSEIHSIYSILLDASKIITADY